MQRKDRLHSRLGRRAPGLIDQVKDVARFAHEVQNTPPHEKLASMQAGSANQLPSSVSGQGSVVTFTDF